MMSRSGNIEISLEPNPYCPLLRLRRATKPKLSDTIYNSETGLSYERIIGPEEITFIEDVWFEFVGNANYSNDQKLEAICKMQKILTRLSNAILEEIEINKLDTTSSDTD